MRGTLGGSKLPCRGQEAPQSALPAVSGKAGDRVKHPGADQTVTAYPSAGVQGRRGFGSKGISISE